MHLIFGIIMQSQYWKLADYIKQAPDLADIRKNMILFPNFSDCVTALRNRNIIAVIWDATVVDYVANQPPCDTLRVGELFDKSNMGFAFMKNSTLVEQFSTRLLELRGSGVVERLIKVRWIDQGSCQSLSTAIVSQSITIHEFWGVFFIYECVFCNFMDYVSC